MARKSEKTLNRIRRDARIMLETAGEPIPINSFAKCLNYGPRFISHYFKQWPEFGHFYRKKRKFYYLKEWIGAS